jgi:hypothetical protein
VTGWCPTSALVHVEATSEIALKSLMGSQEEESFWREGTKPDRCRSAERNLLSVEAENGVMPPLSMLSIVVNVLIKRDGNKR